MGLCFGTRLLTPHGFFLFIFSLSLVIVARSMSKSGFAEVDTIHFIETTLGYTAPEKTFFAHHPSPNPRSTSEKKKKKKRQERKGGKGMQKAKKGKKKKGEYFVLIELVMLTSMTS